MGTKRACLPLLALLCGMLLLALSMVPLTFSSASAQSEQSDGIIVEDADYIWTAVPEYSAELLAAAAAVTPRIIVEYAESLSNPALTASEALNQAASAVLPRIIAEYAESLSNPGLLGSAELNETASTVSPRIVAEYAESLSNPGLLGSAELNEAASTVSPRIVVEYAESIWSAAIPVGPPLDSTPPAAVDSLKWIESTASSVTLTWKATGDDGNTGTASQYDIRYSTSDITEANWYSARQCIGEPSPSVPGASEFFVVGGIPLDITYYFALKTADEVPNWSSLSNVVCRDATDPKHPPTASFTYSTDGLLASFTSTSFDPDGDDDIVSYNWDFGDGGISAQENPTHYYSLDGKYNVTLTVKDSKGWTDSESQQVEVSSGITNVEHPSVIARGLPLRVKVAQQGEGDITLCLDSSCDTKEGNTVEFSVDTSPFDTRRYDLTVNAEGDVYQSAVVIYDPEAQQEIIKGLGDLQETAEQEMKDISRMTGYAFSSIAYDWAAEKILEEVLKELVDETLPEATSQFKYQLFKLRLRLEELGVSWDDAVAFEGAVYDWVTQAIGEDYPMWVVGLADEASEKITGASGDDLKDAVTEWVTGPAVYWLMCKQEAASIDERTESAKEEVSTCWYTPEELELLRDIIPAWKEAISNTDREKIYILHLGTIPIVDWDITAQPTMHYFQQMHDKSLNPGGWWGLGKYHPGWVKDMTIADIQSVLTIPAELNWIEATPEDEVVEPEEGSVALVILVKAVTAYIKYVQFLDKISPYVIAGGMTLSTDLLAKEIKQEYDESIDAILEKGTPLSAGSPKLTGNELSLCKGDIILIITPDGKIVDVEFLESDITLNLTPEYKIVSLSARESYQIASESLDIEMQVLPEKESYSVGETARVNVTVVNKTDEVLEDLLLWFFVVEEDLMMKDVVTLAPQSEVTRSYDFEVSEAGLHTPTACLTAFDQTLAEGYASFTVGEEDQIGAVLTVAYEGFYDPGPVAMDVTVENVCNVPFTPTLWFDDQWKDLGTLPAGERTTETLDFDFTTPGAYEICFRVAEGETTLDAECVEFMVRAWDTLFAFPTCDKAIYHLDETVNVSVVIKDATLQEVSFPYELTIKTPSGETKSEESFVVDEEGTYIVEASAVAEGYALVPGETLFVVERQSELRLDILRDADGISVHVRTDTGGAVAGAKVIIDGTERVTNEEGRAIFEYLNTIGFFARAEKFGFEPAVYIPGPGDADGDSDVDVFDLVKVKRIILELDRPTRGADADMDGDVDVFDLVKVKRIILGIDP